MYVLLVGSTYSSFGYISVKNACFYKVFTIIFCVYRHGFTLTHYFYIIAGNKLSKLYFSQLQ